MGDNQYVRTCGDKLCPCQDGDICHYVSDGRTKAAMLPVTVHEINLRSLRCCVTASPNVTLHHCHGGSVKEAGWHVGVSQKQNPFLQIPLHGEYHTGNHGIDSGMGVRTWEEKYGTQVGLLFLVNHRLPYDIFEQAVMWERRNRGATASRSTAIERLQSMGLSSTAPEKPTDIES